MKKLGNVHSVTTVAHLLWFDYLENLKIYKESVWSIKTYLTFLYWFVYTILLSDKYRVLILSDNYKYTSCIWSATPKRHREVNGSLYVKCQLLLPDSNQNWNDLKILVKTPHYQIQCVQQVSICYMQTDRWQR